MAKKTNYKENLKEYWSFAKHHKVLIVGLMFVVIFLQLLALGDKFIFKYLIDGATNWVSDTITVEVFTSILVALLVAYVLVFFFRALSQWIMMSAMIKLTSSIVFDLKKRYFDHIVKLDQKFHTMHKTGSLISRVGRASSAIDQFTDTIIYALSPFIIQIFVLVPVFFSFNAYTSIILGMTCFVYILYSFFIMKKFQKDRIKENASLDRENGYISDVFTNIDSVKLFGKEDYISQRFYNLTTKTKRAQIKSWSWWKLIGSTQIIILGIGTLFLFGVSAYQLLQGNLTVGELTFIYTAYLGILGPLNWFNQGIRNISRTMTDMQDLFEYGKVKKEIMDKKNAKKLKIKEGDIEFRNIDFIYEKKSSLFNDFTLKIPSGKTIALVGHSGCGKSSLVKLLYRLYDVSKGKVLIDGQDVRSVQQESLRSEMSIVPQEPILFDDTIYNNIKFANPKASRKDVLQAMKFAQLDEFVNRFPKKEKTIVGERGVKLSGGQKQRVSIARAILADKKILVLDEATSALDSRTENEIQKDLQKLMKNRTSIVIAHRLSTIMKADIIVVMQDGKIVQKGTHGELIGRKGEYSELWDLQKGGFLQD